MEKCYLYVSLRALAFYHPFGTNSDTILLFIWLLLLLFNVLTYLSHKIGSFFFPLQEVKGKNRK